MKSKNNSSKIKEQIKTTGKGSPKKIVSNMNNMKNQNNIKNINSIQQKQNPKQNIKNNNKINQYSPKGVKNISYNNKKILSNNNNIYYNKKNNNNKLQSKSVNRVNDIKNKISPPKEIKVKDYQFIEYHPYTLKDYREMIRNPVVLGHLGPNTGTKEWEEKKNKMRKMMNYSNIINKEHKGIVTLKKDSPQDEIEKLTKQKIENSNRFKASEYSKLVRAGKFKDDTNVPNNMYDNYGNQDDNDLLLRRYEEQLRQETENMNKPKEVPPPVVEEKVEPKNLLDIDQLLKQKQDYQHKIKDIRDTLLD